MKTQWRNNLERLITTYRELKEKRITSRMRTSEWSSVMPEFDVDDRKGQKVEEWIEEVERMKVMYDIDDWEILMAIKTKWRGSAQRWLKFRVRDGDTWEQVKEKLVKDFKEKRTMFEIMRTVNTTVRKSGQTLVGYYLEMEMLAEGKLEEEDLVGAVMRGSKNAALRDDAEKGWMVGTRTKDELWTRLMYLG